MSGRPAPARHDRHGDAQPELAGVDRRRADHRVDVTIQKQILDLLGQPAGEIQHGPDHGHHNAGVVAETADRDRPVQKGRKMEEADVLSLFEAPKHPYTKMLLSALPENAVGDRLPTMKDFVLDEATVPGAA